MQVVSGRFNSHRARVLEGPGGREVGSFELARRREEATAVLDGRTYRVVADPDRRRRWSVVEDGASTAEADVPAALVIERPSRWRSSVVLQRADGSHLTFTSRGILRTRLEVSDDAAGGATVARIASGRSLVRATWDLDVDRLAPAERVACIWVTVTATVEEEAVGAAAS